MTSSDEIAALERAKRAIVKVAGGRGFVVEIPRPRVGTEPVVVTAAHCLPRLPPAHGMSSTQERTYANLVGPLDALRATVWAECLFVDVIADLAILGGPDVQELNTESEEYAELIESAPPLGIRASTGGAAWILGLEGHWLKCTLERHRRGTFNLTAGAKAIQSGMSGSPIIQGGAAVGVVCLDSISPSLAGGLPAWMLRGNE